MVRLTIIMSTNRLFRSIWRIQYVSFLEGFDLSAIFAYSIGGYIYNRDVTMILHNGSFGRSRLVDGDSKKMDSRQS